MVYCMRLRGKNGSFDGSTQLAGVGRDPRASREDEGRRVYIPTPSPWDGVITIDKKQNANHE